jgi:hypothetical protein
MPDSSLSRKLLIKPGYRIAIVNAPDGFSDTLGPLPDGVQRAEILQGVFDLVLLFARHTGELAQYGPVAIEAVKPGGILWIAYQKISAKAGSDITRDKGWDVVNALGWDGVSLIAIDSAWSALRFKPGVSRGAARLAGSSDSA